MLNLWQPAGLKEAPAVLRMFGETSLELKRATDDKVEGYGAIFGNVDLGWDLVEAGAFADSLKTDRKIIFLRDHNPSAVIGVWEEVFEDDKGLRVKGRFLTEKQSGHDAAVDVREGALNGLSIGYNVDEWREAKLDNGRFVRIIEKATLWEVSLVPFPMNTGAVTDVKAAAAMTRKQFERALQRGTPLSRKVSVALSCDAFEGVKALSNSGGGDPSNPKLHALSNSGGIAVSDELAGALLARLLTKQRMLEA